MFFRFIDSCSLVAAVFDVNCEHYVFFNEALPIE